MDSLSKAGIGARLIGVAGLLGALAGGCGSSSSPHADGGDAARGDARDGSGEARDLRAEMPTGPDAACGNDPATKRPVAQACGCDADCVSGHCVDGVCCSTACNEGCKTCSAPGSVG